LRIPSSLAFFDIRVGLVPSGGAQQTLQAKQTGTNLDVKQKVTEAVILQSMKGT